MLRFSHHELGDFSRSLRLEWLETNGLGGYAMGTVAGAHTRRYHGLLCVALRPPVDRRMFLSKLEDSLQIDGDRWPLSSNLYGDIVHPDGHQRIAQYRLDPWPIWTYEVKAATVEKAVLMPHGLNAVVVRYTCLRADSLLVLRARPLLAWRDHHHLSRASVEFALEARRIDHGVRLLGHGMPPLLLQIGDGAFWPSTEWYYNLTYPVETARGLDDTEDLYSPGEIQWTLRAGQSVELLAAVGDAPDISAHEICERERAAREQLAEAFPVEDQVARTLSLAADKFVVARPQQTADARSIIAGYPWFTDWGRDAMISLPGLLLTTGRHDAARDVLRAYAEAMQDGLIPNLFPDQGGGAAYNTVDATLWFVASAKRYYDATDDLALFEDGLFDRIEEVVAAYQRGTKYGIRMDQDGLITAGDDTTQLTWMDAKVDDWVVTPRHSKAVEINALWYSAVSTGHFFASKLGREADAYARLAGFVKGSFIAAFWSDELGYLYDCVRGDEKDASLRPNQVIALALPYSPLGRTRQQSILRHVTEELLTPYGLRTLSPHGPAYRGRYEGDRWSRDGAYHQGTVWPWLLGPFVSAHLASTDHPDETKRWLREKLQPLVDHLQDAGLGTISEIFDGDEPHTPRGCPAQAWSVAELLRVWVENGLGEVAASKPPGGR